MGRQEKRKMTLCVLLRFLRERLKYL